MARVTVTFEISDSEREAMNRRDGMPGLATLEYVQQWAEQVISDAIDEYEPEAAR